MHFYISKFLSLVCFSFLYVILLVARFVSDWRKVPRPVPVLVPVPEPVPVPMEVQPEPEPETDRLEDDDGRDEANSPGRNSPPAPRARRPIGGRNRAQAREDAEQ
ncbi:uncharacterized protein LOC110182500 [Drosophila serrata]|uniref:uncharacterized protein LOC110182500 n=1 Tax=Drosophila serrata TaxID=7274 RepID=UPI000A1D1DF3|nr:uncharacterized protein LOC110182500 [Drosophila serrata]